MKKTKFCQTLKMVILLINSIIGVGFISGAEIWSFYAKYGINIYINITIFIAIFYLLINKFAQNRLLNNNQNNKNFSLNLLKIESEKSRIIKQFLNNLCLILVSLAMFSGLKLVLKMFINNYYLITIIVCIVAVFLMLYFGFGAICKFNYLVFVAFFVEIVMIVFDTNFALSNQSLATVCKFDAKFLPAILFFVLSYIFMNMTQVLSVIDGIKGEKITKKQISIFSALFCIIVALVILIISIFLSQNLCFVSFDMPLLEYFLSLGGVIKYFFFVMAVFALLSTLLLCLNSFKNFVCEKVKSNLFSSLFALILSLIFSFVPFKIFIEIVYPIIGVINFVILIIF